MSKPNCIVLGGTFPHITLIKKLRERGYYTILVDFYPNPPAKSFADEHVQESTLDKEKVLELAKDRNAKLVISTCIDQANATACYVLEKLNLHLPYSFNTALQVTDKQLMKKMMLESEVPTSNFITVSGTQNLDLSELSFPLIVKPSDSNSSKGVKIAKTEPEAIDNIAQAINFSRNKKAIVEEFVEGKEIGIDCYVQNGTAHILMVKERRKILSQEQSVQQIYGCIWPMSLSDKVLSYIQEVVNKIVAGFSLDNTPLMIQAMLKGDRVSVIEFAPRIGGGESFRIIKLSSGFDIVEAAIDSFLGNKVEINYSNSDEIYAENFLYAKAGKFGHIGNYDSLIAEGVVEYVDTFRTEGTEIGEVISSNNRVGVFTVKSNNEKELFEKIDKTVKEIEVFDIDGNPMMRNDIY